MEKKDILDMIDNNIKKFQSHIDFYNEVSKWVDQNKGLKISKKIKFPENSYLKKSDGRYILHNDDLKLFFHIGFSQKSFEMFKDPPKDVNLISKEKFEKYNIGFVDNALSNKKMWEDILKDFDSFYDLFVSSQKLHNDLCNKVVEMKEKYQDKSLVFWNMNKLIFNKPQDPFYITIKG